MTRREEASYDVAILGSGFAGSILARGLAAAGQRVVLVEKGQHPRFAIGESSTPLAALALERLAGRPGLADLHDLACWGRWTDRRPGLRRGLKRGFTFYRHVPGEHYRNNSSNDRRLLVAASPHDAIADVHWLRSDVDAALVDAARAAGVDVRENTLLRTVEITDARVEMDGVGPEGPLRLRADRLVDGTGSGGFLTHSLDLGDESERIPWHTGLLFGHLEGCGDFVETARSHGAAMAPGPYPDEKAAVHHLLDEGWMYVLPFDHGVVSCGFVLDQGGPAPDETSHEAWRRLLARYPTLEAQLGGARWVVGPNWIPRVAYRRARAAGPRFALLPHAYSFVDPLFSTGMAWSLLGVERLLSWWVDGEGDAARYEQLLEAEADQITALVAAARATWTRSNDAASAPEDSPEEAFERFVVVSLLYFGVVSFEEVRQRVLAPPNSRPWCWQGFLAADEPAWRRTFAEAEGRVGSGSLADVRRWIETTLEDRDIAGWFEKGRDHLHPVDLDALRARCDRLGLTRDELEPLIPRLMRP